MVSLKPASRPRLACYCSWMLLCVSISHTLFTIFFKYPSNNLYCFGVIYFCVYTVCVFYVAWRRIVNPHVIVEYKLGTGLFMHFLLDLLITALFLHYLLLNYVTHISEPIGHGLFTLKWKCTKKCMFWQFSQACMCTRSKSMLGRFSINILSFMF